MPSADSPARKRERLGEGSIRGAIIAGGGATRFGGRPKGLERVGEKRILDRLVDAFQIALGEPPLLVADVPGADAWRADLRVVPDTRPGLGALGGILTAVREAPAPVVCVAWDMPFVPAPLIAELARRLAAGRVDLVLPESGGPRGVEPLCGAYGPACRKAIEARLDAGDLRAIGFHDGVKVGILNLPEVRAFGDPAMLFFNVNTPGDLSEAEDLWRRHESSQ
jgi:molybdenum cofactor guanylyltransferase